MSRLRDFVVVLGVALAVAGSSLRAWPGSEGRGAPRSATAAATGKEGSGICRGPMRHEQTAEVASKSSRERKTVIKGAVVQKRLAAIASPARRPSARRAGASNSSSSFGLCSAPSIISSADLRPGTRSAQAGGRGGRTRGPRRGKTFAELQQKMMQGDGGQERQYPEPQKVRSKMCSRNRSRLSLTRQRARYKEEIDKRPPTASRLPSTTWWRSSIPTSCSPPSSDRLSQSLHRTGTIRGLNRCRCS